MSGSRQLASTPSTSQFTPQQGHNKFIRTPFAVNFAARVIKTVPFTHPDNACLKVLSKAMGAKFLHREIREKGGCSMASIRTDVFF
eukprot:m.390369 g.390369  ORF g.390369 m.390369 type:complete len:86 (+) comp21058_c0_seq2:471-728(+)